MPAHNISQNSRVKNILGLMRRYYPKATCSLHYDNPFELLVATILSAQCTDKRVNEVTPRLFKKYPTPVHFSKIPLKTLEQAIHSTGFFRAKAKNIKNTSSKILSHFGGKVPDSLDDLVSLPGVGRKTAHVVLGNAFNKACGVVVDTHVKRLSGRFGFTKYIDPLKIEKDLCRILPKTSWIWYSHAIILHGRAVCKSAKPRCNTCFLEEHCPKIGVK